MYQPKVTQTQKYSDSQGDHTVCRGILKLVKTNNPCEPNRLAINKEGVLNIPRTQEDVVKSAQYFRNERVDPIIILNTEEIKEGDYYLNIYKEKEKIYINNSGELYKGINFKILVLRDYFSEKHLNAIVNRKIEDHDVVLVKCEAYNEYNEPDVSAQNLPKRLFLDQQNQITLFPPKQSLEEYLKDKGHISDDLDEILEIPVYETNKWVKEIAEDTLSWAKKNNY